MIYKKKKIIFTKKLLRSDVSLQSGCHNKTSLLRDGLIINPPKAIQKSIRSMYAIGALFRRTAGHLAQSTTAVHTKERQKKDTHTLNLLHRVVAELLDAAE